jgi:hypothetical protein
MSLCGYCKTEQPRRPYSAKRDMPSVTQLLSMYGGEGKTRAMNWAAAEITATTAVHHFALDSVGIEECSESHKVDPGLCQACKYLRYQHSKVWTEKADLGTHIHHLALSWAQGEAILVKDDIKGYVDALDLFYKLWDPEFLETESTIKYQSNPVSYRGTLDFVARIGTARETWLMDIKTGGYYPHEQTLQLAGYRYAQHITDWKDGTERHARRMPVVAHAGVLLLHPDGTFDLQELPATARPHNVLLMLGHMWHYEREMKAWDKEHPLTATEEVA